MVYGGRNVVGMRGYNCWLMEDIMCDETTRQDEAQLGSGCRYHEVDEANSG